MAENDDLVLGEDDTDNRLDNRDGKNEHELSLVNATLDSNNDEGLSGKLCAERGEERVEIDDCSGTIEITRGERLRSFEAF